VPDFATGWAPVADTARPPGAAAVALALMYVAVYLRLMRAGMLEVAAATMSRTARAKGLSPAASTWPMCAQRALPMVTLFGCHFARRWAAAW